MANETQIEIITTILQQLLENDPGCFLVELRIRPGNNINVVLDADKGISIATCIQYNRALYKQIEEKGIFPNGDFSLEVSSPGLDEPLKLHRQFIKNTGRNVEVILNDGTKKEGKLIAVNDQEIVVEQTTGKNKKKEVHQHTLSFENIKSTKIQIVF